MEKGYIIAALLLLISALFLDGLLRSALEALAFVCVLVGGLRQVRGHAGGAAKGE